MTGAGSFISCLFSCLMFMGLLQESAQAQHICNLCSRPLEKIGENYFCRHCQADMFLTLSDIGNILPPDLSSTLRSMVSTSLQPFYLTRFLDGESSAELIAEIEATAFTEQVSSKNTPPKSVRQNNNEQQSVFIQQMDQTLIQGLQSIGASVAKKSDHHKRISEALETPLKDASLTKLCTCRNTADSGYISHHGQMEPGSDELNTVVESLENGEQITFFVTTANSTPFIVGALLPDYQQSSGASVEVSGIQIVVGSTVMTVPSCHLIAAVNVILTMLDALSPSGRERCNIYFFRKLNQFTY